MRHLLIGALLLQAAAAFQLHVTIYDKVNLSGNAYASWPPPHRIAEAACNAKRDIALDIVPSAPQTLAPGVPGLAQPLAKLGT